MNLTNIENIEKVLGGRKIIHKKIRNRIDLVELSRHGLNVEVLKRLATFLRMPIIQLAKFLPVTPRTIQRRIKDKKLLDFAVSEQVLQIAEIIVRGLEVFEDEDKFLAWFHNDNKALGNRSPISLIDSRFGIEIILDELGRIEYGVY